MTEWHVAEDPGTHEVSDLETFYVTNFREPVRVVVCYLVVVRIALFSFCDTLYSDDSAQVSRSISHFKCEMNECALDGVYFLVFSRLRLTLHFFCNADEGRWDCKQVVNNASFIPTEENANKLSTWNQHYGHQQSSCRYRKNYRPSDEGQGYWEFMMVQCAVNCYSQWFGKFELIFP